MRALSLAALVTLIHTTACSDGESSSLVRESRVYVVNTRSESLSVIDPATQEVVETVLLGAQPHGQAPASSGDRLYVTTDGGSGEVIALDPRDNRLIWRETFGKDLNEPHLTLDDRLLFAPDLLTAEVLVVDVQEQRVLERIAMKDPADGSNLVALHNTYASHDGRHMYVTAIFSQKVAQIEVATRRISRVYEVSGDPRPAAISPDDRTLYLQLSQLHGFIALDLDSGSERRVEWPEPAEKPPGYDLGIPTKCHGLELSPDGSQLWAASNLEGTVRVYSVPALVELGVIQVGTMPNWIAFTPDGATAYVTNTDPAAEQGSVSVIDTATRSVTTTLPVGTAPKRVHTVVLSAD